MGGYSLDFLSDDRQNYVVMKFMKYYSENWYDATEKFIKSASPFGALQYARHPNGHFDIPFVKIGTGKNKIVINSGVHGLEGYFGSAAQIMFLDKFAPKLSPTILKKYTIVLIHVINGWGMENRMREVADPAGGLVDLNRNFGVDFSNPKNLPKNPKYKIAHPLLVSAPHVTGGESKYHQMLKFRRDNLADGVWSSISRGQYYEPYGLFYGGNHQMPENKMTLEIYDDVMRDADSLMSIGLHTGLGRFYQDRGVATHKMIVSHEPNHANTQKFAEIFGNATEIVADEPLLGDLVDCLEARYKNIPVATADFEIGTGTAPVRSLVLKRMVL